ncbi:MAG TPA: zinc-dependent alcohol dehydrogenase family protein [Burkholderiales bacterium]|nr:zinc-dependent alcohol dehydrogenase family protein [Burkholderiales bacterium]
MRAMQLAGPASELILSDIPVPEPGTDQIRIKVKACGVCRTDLHVVDRELQGGKLPVVPGHEIVGTVDVVGSDVKTVSPGQRVGVPWLGWTCGQCEYCLSDRENLCDRARFTGFDLDGGYAEFVVADARFCFPLPDEFDDAHAAPLLCAGLIGYRSLVKTGDARRIGIYGFGAAAHIIVQLAVYQARQVYAFTRSGDRAAQAFAMELGATWAGDSTDSPPVSLEAAIIFAPVGELVPLALRAVGKGGRVVCAGIHMSDIPSFPYEILWGERQVVSVANLTRGDGERFLALAARASVRTEIEQLPLTDANLALARLKNGDVRGAFVLRP